MLLTTYHKSMSTMGRTKTNARFLLPSKVGGLLLDYLVYALPFRSHLEYAVYHWQPSPYLWNKGGKAWPSEHVTRSLKKACSRSEVQELTESSWRQMSSAIIKCKFDLGSIDALDPSNSNPYSLEESESASTLISLSNHSAGTHQRAYANTTGLRHAGAWDGLISASYSACASWSDFFRFGSVGKAETVKEESGVESRKRSASTLQIEEEQPIRKRLALSRPAPKPDSAQLLEEARRMYGDPDLKWRSPEQESALLAIVAGDVEVMAILPTGAGKSLLFQLPCALAGARVMVLIVPLVAVKLDLILRSTGLGIDCEEWRPGSGSRARLVVMSVESAVSESGRSYLLDLVTKGELARVVIDECHLIITASSYRKAFDELHLLRLLGDVQFVYLTATLPPSMKDQLIKAHSLTRLNLIRSNTRRPAIEYIIRRLQTSPTSFLTSLSALIPDVWSKSERDGSDRAMLFVRSRRTAEQLAGLLSCHYYHSGTEDKAHVINAWKAGLRGPFIVGTSGLGTGLDYASVRLVVHVEEPYSLIDFAQESGRAGRDGQKAKSLIVILAGGGSQPAPLSRSVINSK
ncbi:putative helicase hus2 [Taphrina deformans PYCC 5710]|uniref:DNA 3'-5' helicase n=1 Tax=Taphrina deformans (strain PYCC 5710 / ATCC 11124 / CBS 356.35 / IMI 108563 / JCM 9778 / NBRC 8474) TaxID=1097556 RepID=R4XHG4_TAPDE|nr:putative helicase hus2 [Taphrina deformans PYCC 5710]|eukprot:CCG85124.1 putative helicase hus2 [Taphrina deformans PYCC 5710]